MLLLAQNAKVVDLRIARRNLAPIRRALIGQYADEVSARLPAHFPVCPAALCVAFGRALDAALIRGQDAAREAARNRLLLAEAALTHIARLAVVWPRAIGAERRSGSLAEGRRILAGMMAGADPAEGRRRLGAILRREFESCTAGGGTAGRLVARLERIQPELPSDPPLARADAAWFDRRLAAAPQFSDAPDRDGAPAEPCGQFSRAGHPALRIRAMLVQAAEDLQRLEEDAVPVEDLAELGHRSHFAGCGIARTARGPLACRLRLDKGRIVDFRVVGPTEWLAHPDGALARALGALSGPEIEADARAVTAAYAPCVGLEFRLVERVAQAS
ncbi:hypothetical protein LNKW23_20070 [Paralimibaculum aggregatum]|uniref:Hydrogenase n=1 Tax=Paralimibaculum aggregatum TaxID=3036245 RepID=A0ABQ6LKM5_9RHOB|nr:hypothetical protein [Limibaculum sp. NKW23]GMG82794.1 hypothetical protein LNKW23_20070 [Limibaculum sp. NKW23]